jgi:hypothetical protein
MALSLTAGPVTHAVLALDFTPAEVSAEVAGRLSRVLELLRAQAGIPDIGRLQTVDLADLYVGLVALRSSARIRVTSVGRGWYSIVDSGEGDTLATRSGRIRRAEFLQRITRLLAREPATGPVPTT